MKRLIIICLGAYAVAVGGAAPTALSSSRVIGGTLAEVQSAPWTVSIRQTVSGGALLCTGSIIDSLHVLTAAHCVYDASGVLAPSTSLQVRAGISNYNTPSSTDVEQDRAVTSFRVHPGYVYSTSVSPDDVAVLSLNQPFDFSGPTVQQTGLPSVSTTFPDRASAQLTGFGRETSFSANGTMNTLTVTVDEQGLCGGFSNAVVPYADAIALCAASPTASICSGDSGAALVSNDASHTLLAVASAAPPRCDVGSHGVYVYLGAPEILSFIQGNDHPVIAPRQNATTYVTLFGEPPLRVGSKLHCDSGNWEDAPSLTYAFIDSKDNKVLQQGSSATLTLNANTVGNTIACRVIATNPGGTAVLETTSTQAVGIAPKLGIEHLTPLIGRRGKATTVSVWIDPETGVSGRFGVCVTPPLSVAPHACAYRKVANSNGGRLQFKLSLKVRSTSPVGTKRVAITAVAGVSHAQAKTSVHVTR